MARVTGSIVIDRPVEEVFDAVADATNEPRYNPAMTASRQVETGPIGVGTHFMATILLRGKPAEVDIEVTRHARPYLLGTRSTMAGSVVVGELRLEPLEPLEPLDSGTRFGWDWDVRVAGLARLLDPLVAIIGRRRERAIWTGLKGWLESGGTSTAQPFGVMPPGPIRADREGNMSSMARSAPDLTWRRLYRYGAWASGAYVVFVLVPIALLFLAPVPPASGAAVLEYIQAHRVVYLAELICFVGLSIPAMVVFTAWAVALWPVDRSLALLGGVFGVGSEITALAVGGSPQSLNGGLLALSDAYRSAPTASERAGLASAADAIVVTTNAMPWAGILTAAAILLLSLAVRRGPCPPALAVFGAVTGALGVVSEALRPAIASAYLLYGLLLPTWFVLIGWRLWVLARQGDGAP